MFGVKESETSNDREYVIAETGKVVFWLQILEFIVTVGLIFRIKEICSIIEDFPKLFHTRLSYRPASNEEKSVFSLIFYHSEAKTAIFTDERSSMIHHPIHSPLQQEAQRTYLLL